MFSRKKVPFVVVALAVVIISLVAGSGAADITHAAPLPQETSPQNVTIPYAGQLNQPDGSPVADGTYDFKFELYDAPEGGSLLWSGTQTGLAVQDGSFSAALGSGAGLPKSVTERKDAWLAVSVRGPGEIGFTALTPRQLLSTTGPTSVAALTCPHNHFGDFWPGSSASYGLVIDNSSTGDGLRTYSRAVSESWGAVFAVNVATTGGGEGVYGRKNLAAGNAIHGHKEGDSGHGIWGNNAGTSGSGVAGYSTGYMGVWGQTEVASGNYGLYSPDNLFSANIHTTGAIMMVMQNAGSTPLEPGDLAVFSGMSAPLSADGPSVIQVSRAAEANSPAVAGVVASRYNIKAVTDATSDGANMIGEEVTPDGAVQPGEYLLLVVQGPAQVKASAVVGTIQPGELLSSSPQPGRYAAASAPITVEGAHISAPGTVFGKALQPLAEGDALIWIYVTLN